MPRCRQGRLTTISMIVNVRPECSVAISSASRVRVSAHHFVRAPRHRL